MLSGRQHPSSSWSQVLMLFPGMDTVLQPGGELVPGPQPAGQLAQSPRKSKLSQGQTDRSHPPPKSHMGWAWGGSHIILMSPGALVLTCGQAGAQVEGWMGPWEQGAIPTAQLGLSWRQHPSSCLNCTPGSLLLSCDAGSQRVSWTKVWKKSLRNSHISSSYTPQVPSTGPRCPREEEGGKPDPDPAINGAKHRGPVMSLCHVPLLSARASFLPLPSPLTTPPPPVTRIGRHRGGNRARAAPGPGDRGALVSAPVWGRGPRGLLVGEAVGVGEELLRGESILGHVAGAAADQVVRHAAGRHRDPT